MPPFDQKLQKMMEEIAEKKATEVYNKLGTKYNVASVPAHVHNSVDTQGFNIKNLAPGNKYTSTLIVDSSDTYFIGGIFNPANITFMGYAANTGGSPTGAASEKALINGQINFGTCFLVTDIEPPIVVQTSGAGQPFTQMSNFMYFDEAAVANTTVGQSPFHFAIAAEGGAGTIVASGQVTAYNNQTGVMTIDVVLATGWVMLLSFTIT